MRINVRYSPNGEAEATLTEPGTSAEELNFTDFMSGYAQSRAKLAPTIRQAFAPDMRSLDLLEMRHAAAPSSGVIVRDRAPAVTSADARRAKLAAVESQVEASLRAAVLECVRYGKEARPEARALGGSGSAGDYLTYQEFQDRVFNAEKAADAITSPDVITVITTKTGTPFPIPLSDDTSGVADAPAENAALSTSDLVFEQLMLPACSKAAIPMWKWSLEMVQDSGVDVESFLVAKAGPRLARKEGALLVAALASGSTSGVSAGASAIVPANIWDLYGSIDPAYIASAKCAWLMRESTFIAISKLVDTAGLPVFPVRRNPAGDFELLAHPVRFCPSAAAIGTGNKSVFFGDLSALILRRQRDSFRITRYDELFATSGGVGFSGFERISVGFAKASTADSPVKFLQHA